MNELQFRLAVDCYVDAMVVACRRPSFDCRLAATHFLNFIGRLFSKTSQPPSNRPQPETKNSHTRRSTIYFILLMTHTIKDRYRIHYTITCTRDAYTGTYHTPKLILHIPLNLLCSPMSWRDLWKSGWWKAKLGSCLMLSCVKTRPEIWTHLLI